MEKTKDFFGEGQEGNGAPARKVQVRKGYLTAYRKGRRARRAGDAKVPPYKSANDWRRVFRFYWNEGWRDEEQGQPERYSDE